MKVPLTDRVVLDGLIDRFLDDPTADRRSAIVSLFDATVNDSRAVVGRPVGFVCVGRDGQYARLYPECDSLEVGTTLYARC